MLLPHGNFCLLPILGVHHEGSGVPRARLALTIPSSLPAEPLGLQTPPDFLLPALFLPPETSAGWEHWSFDFLPGGSAPDAPPLPARRGQTPDPAWLPPQGQKGSSKPGQGTPKR